MAIKKVPKYYGKNLNKILNKTVIIRKPIILKSIKIRATKLKLGR